MNARKVGTATDDNGRAICDACYTLRVAVIGLLAEYERQLRATVAATDACGCTDLGDGEACRACCDRLDAAVLLRQVVGGLRAVTT